MIERLLRANEGDVHAGNRVAGTGVYPAGPGRPDYVADHATEPRSADPVLLPGGFHAWMHTRGMHVSRPACGDFERGTLRCRGQPASARAAHRIPREI